MTTLPTEQRYTGKSGLRIAYRSWHPAGAAKAAVLIVPGFNSHSGYYGWVAEELSKQGFAVYAVDLRGRGLSDGERFYVDSIDDYVADVHGVMQIVRQREPGLKVFLFGHSAGGVTACIYALDHQDELPVSSAKVSPTRCRPRISPSPRSRASATWLRTRTCWRSPTRIFHAIRRWSRR
jgi:alpha-beta hydrolase superfamily lysophospholipase